MKQFQVTGNNGIIRSISVVIEAESEAAARQIFFQSHGTSLIKVKKIVSG